MNRERIERAIRILKNAPPEKFNLYNWARFTKDEEDAIRSGAIPPVLNGCGTSGCAMGWIASDASCIAEGLHLSIGQWAFSPKFGRSEDFGAAKSYFDFASRRTAENLFSPDEYDQDDIRSPKAVIDRLETLLAGGEQTFNFMCAGSRVAGW